MDRLFDYFIVALPEHYWVTKKWKDVDELPNIPASLTIIKVIGLSIADTIAAVLSGDL